MKRRSLADMDCSVARALDVVGDPWTLLILRDLLRGHTRFDEFQQSMGIPRNTLTTRLRSLTDDGIVKRVPYQDRPPRYEYRLTRKGRALNPVVVTMMRWGDEWGGLDTPPIELVDAATDRRLDPILVDRETGTPLRDLDVEARPTR